MGLGLVTVLRTDNVLVTSCFTVTLIVRPWSTKIEQIGIFASHKPCKNETRMSNSAIDVVTDDVACEQAQRERKRGRKERRKGL